jgi:transcriptional regulator with XRE-family HTH domain
MRIRSASQGNMAHAPQDKAQRARKAEALRRRMSEMAVTEEKVAELCGLKSRDAVTKWRAGKYWPYLAGEHALEDVLTVPRGFFVRIGDGMEYEEALQETDEASQSLPIPSPPPYLPVVQEAWRYLEEAAAANLRAQLALQTLLGPHIRLYSGEV